MLAYVINLDRRQDRQVRMITRLGRLGIQMERIAAVDGKLWDGNGWKTQGRCKEDYWRGAAGCYFSHIKALERAIERDVFPCLILEDDCWFHEKPAIEPGMVYLGGFESEAGIYGMHAMSYSDADCAKKFLTFLKAHKNTNDSIANKWRKMGNATKYSKGFIAVQTNDYSDIQQREVKRTASGAILVRPGK